MRIDEAIQQPGQKERTLKENILKSLNVAIPGEIVSYDSTQRTAVIQPTIREWNNPDNPPLLLDVPVFMWGNYQITPTKNDKCLVIFADRCVDAWLQSGGVSSPVVSRFHDMSDGFAFVGFNKTGGQDFPTILDSFVKKEDVANNLTTTEEGKVLDARQGKVLADHFSILGTDAAPITDLSQIPINSIGNCILDASISPTGIKRSQSYYKTGWSQTRYTIMVTDQYSEKTFFQVNYDGTLSGWKELFNSSEIIPVANGGTGATTADAARANLEAMYGKAVRLGSGDNLDNINTPGFYEISTGVLNSPIDWCAMIVVPYNVEVYQIAFRRDRCWVRDYTGNPPNWSAWSPMSLMAGTVPNNTDLNSVVTPGYYLLSVNYTYTNMPTGAATMLVLKTSMSASAILQVCYGVGRAPCHRFRTDATTWSAWITYALDSAVVHNTGNETVAGTKTFSSALLFERGASNAGTLYSVLRARFKSQDGTVQFEAIPVRIIGNDAAGNYNAGVVIGSNNGITIVGAGESSGAFASKNNIYDGEDMYLVSDGFIRMYTGVANDGTVKGYYQYPVLDSGVILDMSKAANLARPPVMIPKNADLDDYKTPGSYEVYDSVYAATMAHIPATGTGGRLDVFETYRTNGAYVRQIYHKGGGNPDTYIREASSSGVFGSWYKINMTAV